MGKIPPKAKLVTDLNEPLLIRNKDELIADNTTGSSPPVQSLSPWRRVKKAFLETCLFLSIVEISAASSSSSKVVRQSMDGRDVDPTFN